MESTVGLRLRIGAGGCLLWSRRGSVTAGIQGRMTWVALLQGSGARVGAGCHKYMQRRRGSGAGGGTGGPVGVGTAPNDGCGGCKLQVCRSCWTAQTMAQPRAESGMEEVGVPRRLAGSTPGAGAGAVVEVGLQEHVGSGWPRSLASRKKGHRSNCQAGGRAVRYLGSAGWKRVWEKRRDEEKNSIRLEEGRRDGRTAKGESRDHGSARDGREEKRMKSSATRRSPGPKVSEFLSVERPPSSKSRRNAMDSRAKGRCNFA